MGATASIGTRVRHRRRAAAALGVVAVALACSEEPAPAPPVARPVKILTVGGVGAGGSLEFPGKISPTQNAEPAFEVAGKIIEFPVVESQALEEGDVIARLDPRDYQSELDKATANERKAEVDLQRYRTLYEKGVNPKSDLDGAQRRYEVTLAGLKTAQKALEDSVLRAPFSGTVAKKLVDDFQNVQAKQPIVVLQDESTLQIEVFIPERDFARMTPGLSNEERTRRANPQVSLSSIPGRTFPARIKEFSTTADPVTRTFTATFEFDPPPDVTIRSGMTAKITLKPRAGQAGTGGISLPARAVLTDETGEAFVWVVDPATMKVERSPVVVGELEGESIVVRSGLTDGQQVAVSGVHELSEGAEVRRFGE